MLNKFELFTPELIVQIKKICLIKATRFESLFNKKQLLSTTHCEMAVLRTFQWLFMSVGEENLNRPQLITFSFPLTKKR